MSVGEIMLGALLLLGSGALVGMFRSVSWMGRG